MGIKRHIPNFITTLNLACGCVAAVMAFEGHLDRAFWFMLLSLLFDFCDGMAARALKSYSEIGRELDSLADVVSFGFVPGLMMWRMGGFVPYAGFLLTIFAALRLAKFNIDTREHDVFYGLATPSMAVFFGSLAYLSQESAFFAPVIGDEFVRLGLIALFCSLMVCGIPMFSLKFKSNGFKENALPYCFIIFSVAAVAIFRVAAVPFIILSYIAVSVIIQLAGCRK